MYTVSVAQYFRQGPVRGFGQPQHRCLQETQMELLTDTTQPSAPSTSFTTTELQHSYTASESQWKVGSCRKSCLHRSYQLHLEHKCVHTLSRNLCTLFPLLLLFSSRHSFAQKPQDLCLTELPPRELPSLCDSRMPVMGAGTLLHCRLQHKSEALFTSCTWALSQAIEYSQRGIEINFQPLLKSW